MSNEMARIIKKAHLLLDGLESIEKGLQEIGVIRSRRIVGDLGEWLSTQIFSLVLEKGQTNKGFDCIHPSTKERYQIKTARKANTNLSPIRIKKKSITNREFDWLVIIRLNDSFRIRELYKVSCETIESRFSLHTNGLYIMSWKKMADDGYQFNPRDSLQQNPVIMSFFAD